MFGDDGAFPSLVMPANTKDLVLAFAESQVKRQQSFDDFIHGKGKGTIMLLSGPPGTGKTLTAESVAEVMRTPLYLLSAGDLGTDPKEVEKNTHHHSRYDREVEKPSSSSTKQTSSS